MITTDGHVSENIYTAQDTQSPLLTKNEILLKYKDVISTMEVRRDWVLRSYKMANQSPSRHEHCQRLTNNIRSDRERVSSYCVRL